MTSKNRVIAEWAREARDSSIWFALLLFVILSIVIGTLDVIYWDKNFGRNIIAEANAVLIDIFVIGIVVAFYEYQRRVNRAADDAQKELTVLGTLGGRDSVPRKVELIDLLASNGRKPISLQSYQLRGAKLNGRDLSRVDMRFVVLKESPLVRTVLIGSDLLCADLRESVLVEANMSGANLYEANFGGAWLSRASLTGADVKHANFRGARAHLRAAHVCRKLDGSTSRSSVGVRCRDTHTWKTVAGPTIS